MCPMIPGLIRNSLVKRSETRIATDHPPNFTDSGYCWAHHILSTNETIVNPNGRSQYFLHELCLWLRRCSGSLCNVLGSLVDEMMWKGFLKGESVMITAEQREELAAFETEYTFCSMLFFVRITDVRNSRPILELCKSEHAEGHTCHHHWCISCWSFCKEEANTSVLLRKPFMAFQTPCCQRHEAWLRFCILACPHS